MRHQLTLRLSDAVRATQQQLPENLRVAFQQTLRPDFIAVLHESLPPLNSTLLEHYQEVQNTNHDILAKKWREHYEDLSAGIREIKEDMKSSRMTQLRIESSIKGNIPRKRQDALPAPEELMLESEGNEESIEQILGSRSAQLTQKMAREALTEV